MPFVRLEGSLYSQLASVHIHVQCWLVVVKGVVTTHYTHTLYTFWRDEGRKKEPSMYVLIVLLCFSVCMTLLASSLLYIIMHYKQ